jgi:hypothetical protein
MKESVAVAKEADAKRGFSPTRSDKSVQYVRDAHERQLGSLRGVISNIRRDGGKPSVESIATQLSFMPTGERAPALLALQQTHGNRYVQRVVAGIQAKLVVGQPGDKYEQEADRMADAVMQMSEPKVQRQLAVESMQPKLKRTTEYFIQRQEEKEEILQTKNVEDSTPEVSYDLESQIHTLRGGGNPLSESMRSFFEPRFGYDFSQVRVHTDARAAEIVRAVNAQAFTIGRDVVFGAGEYAPETGVGRQLLAHELTHVVQQTVGGGIQYSSKPHNIEITTLGEQISRSFRIRGTDNYERIVNGHLDQLRRGSETAENLYVRLSDSWTVVEINEVTGGCATGRVQNVALVHYNCSRCPGTPNGIVPNYIYLGHELIHALHHIEGTHTEGPEEEWRTVGLGRHATLPFTENRIRCEKGIPPRTFYYATDEARYRRQGYETPQCVNDQYEHPLPTTQWRPRRTMGFIRPDIFIMQQ